MAAKTYTPSVPQQFSSFPVSRADAVETMARAIYLRLVTSSASVQTRKTALAENALADAEAFQSVLERWRNEITKTTEG